jgi:hypothetical protein
MGGGLGGIEGENINPRGSVNVRGADDARITIALKKSAPLS